MHPVVIGGGSFGTAIGCALAQTCSNVTILVRCKQQALEISSNRRNSKYFPEYKLPKKVKATVDFTCLNDADVVFLALPAHAIQDTCDRIQSVVTPNTPVLNLAKGLHDKCFTLDKAIRRALPANPIGALKGPSFSRPILQGAPSGLTVAMSSPDLNHQIRQLFRNSSIMVDEWHDVSAVEFISAVKNVLAIVMGIGDATEDNPNTRFLIMQKILHEANSLLEAFHFDARVLFTYAGCGDLLMTSLSDNSRNRTLGLLIGRGFAFTSSASGPVLEGKRSIRIITSRLKNDKEHHPLLFALENVFRETMSPEEFFTMITRS
jgi:glycerol-3-phosphate dehydrogenase (NAD(P)+)